MIDVATRLRETNAAIAVLRHGGHGVPEEAVELQEVYTRCIAAENLIASNLQAHLELGRGAYEAYCRHTNNKSLVSGQELPKWEALSDAIRGAWNVSAAWTARRVAIQLLALNSES